ncbi:TPA: hypothetical protein DEQ22_02895 [Candidatus Nomurabacteria bacterium]|uniref:Lcl C-terminal domain-containing protein n=2 Tax=Candidatus Nomuraibacteriota TaxID=1752729 RepID=A0A1F6YQ92_9BACT|nr:MAG: hypothetical protein UV13_C0010G0016 [Parcubacteria group bacterium GW2011_GWC1_42_21]KKS57883.1 MAG: hypothetical protein UV23_C0021G0016 [Candidatus Nomurabacteria bacterium GW2011_GWF1_42_40]KKS99976.1 MAG: hypothetical protein UV77_C0009G0016 [Candidatus Nomurabacteria bacterium GW2011_GWA1_43_17]KKT06818.1 MAG: hypothetical protein UV85_C0015G0016 [Candidatus Nomurabacteria bacterium GW2011_GWB1_43_19]KKT10829.1 MAG: hypothetical protein UV91_C0010G0016 [Candidatus Nomurabacteria b
MLSILKNKKGFTLIELLVVVAIIGILASVVLASLNIARGKGTAAAIKSNLKNAIAQAELSYSDVGDYSGACTAIAKMLTAVTSAGASSACYSYNNAGLSDVYQRWGASGIKGTSTPIQAWSSSPTGAATWDVQGVNFSGVFVGADVTMNWDTANTACGIAGGRLPTTEELKTLSDATYTASGNTTRTPPGFVASFYWSSTTVPFNSAWAYGVNMTTGVLSYDNKPSNYYVRCVR